MKLAIIGDLHLDDHSPRYVHTLDVWDWIIKNAAFRGADAWALAGDLCEGAPRPAVYTAMLKRLGRMTKYGPVGIVEGNHEADDAVAPLNEFPGVTAAWDRTPFIDFTVARVLLVPYPRRGKPPFHDLEEAHSIRESMEIAAKWIGIFVQDHLTQLEGKKPLIVVGHFTIEGMGTRDTDFELHTATEVVVPVAAFDGVALTIVGHIHKAQDVSPRILGVGGAVRHSFAEAADPKSYLLVSVDGDSVTWERILVPAREMIEKTIEWDQACRQLQDPLSYWFSPTDLVGKEVKVVVKVSEEHLATYDPTVFDEAKRVAASFVLDKRTQTAQRVRAPEIAKGTTLIEQVESWCRATNQDISPERMARLGEKLAGLENDQPA